MAKKGFIARLIEGPERSETYARSTLPTNRWELGWDVFKTNKGKLFGLNLLSLLFMIPIILIFLMRYMSKTVNGQVLPFANNFGISWPIYPMSAGLEAQHAFSLNIEMFKYIIIGVAVASVAISGGFYVMRNMVWAEGVMVTSDFFRGVKKNYFVVFFSLLIYTVIMMLSLLSVNMSAIMLGNNQGVAWLLVTAQVISYLIMAMATIMVMFMITLGINYKLSFFNLIRNSFILTIALIPTNVFFALFSAVWFVLLFIGGQFFSIIGFFLVVIWGLSLFMLVWTDYSHWVFDKFINDKVPGAKKNRGIYKTNAQEDDGEELVIEKSKLKERYIKPITDYDVELYELPTSFSRKDLEKLEETKEAMRQDSDRYSEEHKDDHNKKQETIEDLMKEDEKQNEKKDSKGKK
ncbi:MAG: hypothetical protein IJC87_07210 [Clostridia bacterium]|nr:hypothetical protein [Clostridia bacterium]